MTPKKAIDHLRSADTVLAHLIDEVGKPRLRSQREPNFESLARVIVFQQLSGTAALSIYKRLEGVTGGAITPAAILALSETQMRSAGLSMQKVRYVRDLASRTLAGELEFERLSSMSDGDVIEHLTRVKGIGVWSAQMFLIFALQRLDVMPTDDFALNTAIKKHYRKRKVPKAEDILRIAERWRPYRSVACLYLWESVDKRPPAPNGTGSKSRKQ